MLRKSSKEWDSIYRTIGKTYYNRENVDLPMGIRRLLRMNIIKKLYGLEYSADAESAKH